LSALLNLRSSPGIGSNVAPPDYKLFTNESILSKPNEDLIVAISFF